MIKRLALLLCLLAPVAARAQAVGVISGEHEDFSRLVVMFEAGVNWSFGRVDGGFEFRAEAPEIRYRLDRVFERIPRDRIAAVEDRGDGRLFLAVNCACHGDAFGLRGGEVALDIKDGPPIAAAQDFNQTLPDWTAPAAARGDIAAERAEEPATPPPGDGPPLPVQARQGLPLFVEAGAAPTPGAQDPAAQAEPAHPVQTDGEAAPPPGEGEDTPPPSDRVTETRDALIEQLGRAASQGLLEPDLAATETLVRQATDPGAAEAIETTDPVPEAVVPPAADAVADGGHVRIQTSIDRDNEAAQTPAALTPTGASCLPDRFFDIAGWGALDATGPEIGRYRSQILGEFDIPRPDQVTALARHYLYLTFGAEAVALVKRYPDGVERADLLVILAEIMDGLSSSRAGEIAPQLGCDAKVALWAVLAQPDLRPAQPVATSAVVASFSELPLHLRRHLGPALAERFLNAGDASTALALRNALGRAPGDHGAEYDLMEARIDLARDETGRATERLEEIVARDAALAPEAIVELIDARLAAGQIVSERDISLAASLAFERRGTEMGLALLRAEIRARARGGDFSTALDLLGRARDEAGLVDEDARALHGEIIARLVSLATDAVFLRHAVGLGAQTPLPQPVRRDLAQRFLALGFPAEAGAMLAGSPEVPGPQDRLLFARIALAEEKYQVAISYLTGLEDAAAQEVRALALAGLRDHDAAAAVWASLGNAEAQARQAWRGGDWAGLARLDEGALGRTGALMLAAGNPQAEPGDDGTLARDAALLDRAREMRHVLEDLLENLPPPEPASLP